MAVQEGIVCTNRKPSTGTTGTSTHTTVVAALSKLHSSTSRSFFPHRHQPSALPAAPLALSASSGAWIVPALGSAARGRVPSLRSGARERCSSSSMKSSR